MERMSSEPVQPSVLPFVAAQPLVDHHCHGILRAAGDLAGLLNEADGDAMADGLPFDSLAGLAFRRWCPPLLGLPSHAGTEAYAERRAALGADEVSRRFLGACGLAALCVDTGYAPAGLTSPAETAGLAGAAAYEIVRLEQVAESLARDGTSAAQFPDAYRKALADRVAAPSFGTAVVGVKSIAAYRVGLELDGRRPADGEVVTAVTRWLGRGGGGGPAERGRRGAAAACRRGAAPVLHLVRRRPRPAGPVPRRVRRPGHRPAPVQPAAAYRAAAGARADRGAGDAAAQLPVPPGGRLPGAGLPAGVRRPRARHAQRRRAGHGTARRGA